MLFTLLWLAFFVQGMTPGFWFPALTNILEASDLGNWVMLAFVVPPICSLISPLIAGALADQWGSADRLFAWSSIICALALAAAFGALDAGWHPMWFLALLGIFSLFATPQWGLLATISLTHLSHGERQYPLVRVGATIGWISAGLLTSYVLRMDTSPKIGYVAAAARLIGGIMAFKLPHTPPLGKSGSWKSRLGFDAFSLMKDRNLRVFFLVTVLFSIPLTAFYMYAPEFLKQLGDPHPTATMTTAQGLEIVTMLMLGTLMTRYRVKTLLLWALGISVLRYGMSALAGETGMIAWHIAGVALHGICFTFFFITAQVYLDQRVAPALKGQAQGLLSIASNGIGPLLGALFCGWLRVRCIQDGIQGWSLFWSVLALTITVCFVIFALFYHSVPREKQSQPG